MLDANATHCPHRRCPLLERKRFVAYYLFRLLIILHSPIGPAQSILQDCPFPARPATIPACTVFVLVKVRSPLVKRGMFGYR